MSALTLVSDGCVKDAGRFNSPPTLSAVRGTQEHIAPDNLAIGVPAKTICLRPTVVGVDEVNQFYASHFFNSRRMDLNLGARSVSTRKREAKGN